MADEGPAPVAALGDGGVLRRGPLSPLPVFYRVEEGMSAMTPVVRFSSRPQDLVIPGSPVWAASTATELVGGEVVVPLSPYEGVFQLACGTALRVVQGRVRLELEDLDVPALIALADDATSPSADPGERVRQALALALSDLASGATLALGDVSSSGVPGELAVGAGDAASAGVVVGDGGGLGAAALAAAGEVQMPRLHVHVDVPVMDRRRRRVQDAELLGGHGKDLRVVDVSGRWTAAIDGGPPAAGHDPWLLGPDILPEAGLAGARLVSAQGLTDVFKGVQSPAGWIRRGWRRLTDAAPPLQADGQPWWRAWRPADEKADLAAPEVGNKDDPDSSAGRTQLAARIPAGGWLVPQVRTLTTAVSAAHTTTHLVAEGSPAQTAAVISAVVELLERNGIPPYVGDAIPGESGARRADPVLIAAHPLVVGTALSLAARNQLGAVYRDGCLIDAPLLRALLPAGWRAADIHAGQRKRLLAAAVVSQRLATRAQRARLLEQAAASPWIDVAQLRQVLSNPDTLLAHAGGLHALMAVVARYPDVLATEPTQQQEHAHEH